MILPIIIQNELQDAIVKTFQIHSSCTLPNQSQIEALFSAEKTWEGKYRQLILLGKQLPALAPELKIPDNELSGCESKVWILARLTSNSSNQNTPIRAIYLSGESESRIISGLIALVIIFFSGKSCDSKEEINKYDATEWLHHLGVSEHLTSTRKTGVNSMQTQIKSQIWALINERD